MLHRALAYSDPGTPPSDPGTPPPQLSSADAWLLLREPGLNLHLAADLPIDDGPGEQSYRTVHRWIDARRANRTADELALRKTLQVHNPILFRYLKQSANPAGLRP